MSTSTIPLSIYLSNHSSIHPRPTLQPPELQHQGAALQVVQQPLGAAGAAEVEPVVQQGVDVVPRGRRVERLGALKEPEAEGTENQEQTGRTRDREGEPVML